MANKDLLKKIMKASLIKETSLLSESEIYNEETFIPTKIPLLNLFLSGKFNGGIAGNHTAIAGASASFKSMIGLILMKTYLDYYEDGYGVLYDSEKGITKDYLGSIGIDSSRIIIKPFPTLETLKNDLSVLLDTVNRDDHILILIDSISNSASKKELEDALKGDDKADMTRAKVIKSIFRIATSSVAFKNIPLISINHTYSAMDMYKEDEISGGTGIKYSASSTLRISKLKGDKDVGGVNFKIKAGKSRYIKENSTFLLTIPDDGKLRQLSGLFELAFEYGFITSESQGWYEVPCLADIGKVRKKEIQYNKDVWKRIFEETNFRETVENAIKVSQDQKTIFEDIEEEANDILNTETYVDQKED